MQRYLTVFLVFNAYSKAYQVIKTNPEATVGDAIITITIKNQPEVKVEY